MRLHKRRLLFLLPLLAGLPLIPSMAGAEGAPTVEAKNEGPYNEERHFWFPQQTTISSGGTVAFTNPTTVAHGIEWIGAGPKPTCDATVPVGSTPAASGTNWSGTCTFAQNGLYRFYCTVHGEAMQGRVVVQNGIITTSTSTTQSSTTGTTTTTTGTPTPQAPAPLLVGPASKALKLPRSQHGKLVRGSIDAAAGAAGGKLEVDLLANRAVLAKFVRVRQARVGRLLSSSLSVGPVAFKVPLTAKGKRALRARRRLALQVVVVLTPASGSPLRLTRRVVLHP